MVLLSSYSTYSPLTRSGELLGAHVDHSDLFYLKMRRVPYAKCLSIPGSSEFVITDCFWQCCQESQQAAGCLQDEAGSQGVITGHAIGPQVYLI